MVSVCTRLTTSRYTRWPLTTRRRKRDAGAATAELAAQTMHPADFTTERNT
ncbi:hypothetical protein SAMN05216275_11995 [Streptosporangium canum]|uniref:Uncharacterized protein n=1 Tax=Streptosporangium canum TaxID=324952 RepID=A0A1I3XLP8_9ACTN|nr:hypothetical protein SAMN05216275_11995 [Streptosporangium canum]